MLRLSLGALSEMLHGGHPECFASAARKPEQLHLLRAEFQQPADSHFTRGHGLPSAGQQGYLHHRASGEVHTPLQ